MSRGRWLLMTLFAVTVAVGAATPAYAHNSLTASDPEDGETREQAPDEVRLTFLSALDPANTNLDVTGPGGRSVVHGEPDFDGDTVTVRVRIELAGDYRVGYEVLSSDGDWVDGTVAFTVASGASPTPPPVTATSAPPQPPATAEETDSDRRAPGWLGPGLAALALAGAGLIIYRRLRN